MSPEVERLSTEIPDNVDQIGLQLSPFYKAVNDEDDAAEGEDEEEEKARADATLCCPGSTWLNVGHVSILYCSVFLLIFLLYFGLTKTQELLKFQTQDNPSGHQNVPLVYSKIILTTTSMVANLAAIGLIIVSPQVVISVTKFPFLLPFLISDFLHWTMRYVQTVLGILEHHYHLCHVFGTAMYFFCIASTIWMTTLILQMTMEVRRSWVNSRQSDARQRVKRILVIHAIVWTLTIFFTVILICPYARKDLAVDRFLEGNVGCCVMHKAKSVVFLTVPGLCLLLSIIMVLVLRRGSASGKFPLAAKADIDRLTNRLLFSFMLSRGPMTISRFIQNIHDDDQAPANMFAVVLFFIGGSLYALTCVSDYFHRTRTLGQNQSVNLPLIDASHVERLDKTSQDRLDLCTGSQVYKALWDKHSVMIRKFTPEHREEAEAIEQEALLSSQLQHCNILYTYGMSVLPERSHEGSSLSFVTSLGDSKELGGTVPADIELVTEAIAGTNMYHLLLDFNINLSYLTILKWSIQICQALCYLHEQPQYPIVHRGLNLKCCVVAHDQISVKILNLNMARAMDPKRGYRRSMSTASPQLAWWYFQNALYCMAPELAIAHHKYTLKVDSYSMGMVLWQLCCRSTDPYGHLGLNDHELLHAVVTKNIRPSIPDFVPVIMKELISRCWHPDPKIRPSMGTILSIVQAECFKRQVFHDLERRGSAAATANNGS